MQVLRSAVATKDKERADRATLVAQEKLIQGGCIRARSLSHGMGCPASQPELGQQGVRS